MMNIRALLYIIVIAICVSCYADHSQYCSWSDTVPLRWPSEPVLVQFRHRRDERYAVLGHCHRAGHAGVLPVRRTQEKEREHIPALLKLTKDEAGKVRAALRRMLPFTLFWQILVKDRAWY